jgi:hypothetical protein
MLKLETIITQWGRMLSIMCTQHWTCRLV